MYLWERDSASDHPRGPLAAARASYVNIRYGLVAPGGGKAECPAPPETVAASVVRTAFRRTKTGRRVLRITLDVDEPITVTAKLTRGGKALARAKRKLKKGTRTFSVALPASATPGSARLALVLRDEAGTKRTVNRSLKVPSSARDE